jgi:hypothetical protein
MKKILILLIFSAQSAVAADKNPPSTDAYVLMTQMLAGQCSSQVSNIINDPDWAPLIKARPVNVSDICSCAMQGFKTDEKLKQALTFDVKLEPNRLESKKLRSYFVMRLVQSMFSCVSTEFSQVLNENDPMK